uniref:Prolyl 4-hydroxylase alpha subunit domain-containing protein n=1 Tax=Ananas comosus var. bracteatus TaxID=296719 RepID=A0A6V7PWW8_ANACO|nr:unnamed protein product [Ananas comosus var. bracteatus]
MCFDNGDSRRGWGDGEQRRKKTKTKTKTSRAKEMGGRWPAIKPKKDLQINRLRGTLLFTVPNFFSAAEASAFVEAAEAIGFTHQGSLGPARGQAYRDNDRISITDPLLAEIIWESGLKKIFDDVKLPGEVAVGLNPNIRFYRYTVGQRGKGNNKDSSAESLVGGETVFYDQRGRVVAEVAPVPGMALLHIHGDDCMLHEARVVTKNIKYVLRSDVSFA